MSSLRTRSSGHDVSSSPQPPSPVDGQRRSRIVPRWIALWGLVAILIYLTAHLLAMYAVIDTDPSEQVLMFMPLAVQEMVLAVWMIARGFRPAAVDAPHDDR